MAGGQDKVGLPKVTKQNFKPKQDKTNNLKMSLWDLGNSDEHFSRFSDFIE